MRYFLILLLISLITPVFSQMTPVSNPRKGEYSFELSDFLDWQDPQMKPGIRFFAPDQKTQIKAQIDLEPHMGKEKSLIFSYEGVTGSASVFKKKDGFTGYILHYDGANLDFLPPAAQIFPEGVRLRADFYSRTMKTESITNRHSSPLFLATVYGEWLENLRVDEVGNTHDRTINFRLDTFPFFFEKAVWGFNVGVGPSFKIRYINGGQDEIEDWAFWYHTYNISGGVSFFLENPQWLTLFYCSFRLGYNWEHDEDEMIPAEYRDEDYRHEGTTIEGVFHLEQVFPQSWRHLSWGPFTLIDRARLKVEFLHVLDYDVEIGGINQGSSTTEFLDYILAELRLDIVKFNIPLAENHNIPISGYFIGGGGQFRRKENDKNGQNNFWRAGMGMTFTYDTEHVMYRFEMNGYYSEFGREPNGWWVWAGLEVWGKRSLLRAIGLASAKP